MVRLQDHKPQIYNHKSIATKNYDVSWEKYPLQRVLPEKKSPIYTD